MWKKILKIDMEEARRLGDRYASEDMDAARDEKERVNQEEIKPAILLTLRRYIAEQDEDNIVRLRNALSMMLRDFPDAPRLSRSTSLGAKNLNENAILTALGEPIEE